MSRTIDFDKSFVSWLTKSGSHGRFGIEAHLGVDQPDGSVENFYLLNKVMAGNVYADDFMPKDPPYSYQAVFSDQGQYKIFRYYIDGKASHSVGLAKDRFEQVSFDLIMGNGRVINEANQVLNVFDDREKIVGRIFGNGFMLSFPVKHLNVQKEPIVKFQVETGPVLLPQLSENGGMIGELKMAYIYVSGFSELQALLCEKGKKGYSVFQKYPSSISFFSLDYGQLPAS